VSINAAGGLVKNSNNEFLLIFRRGKLYLPKGKLNNGEFFERAALREVEDKCWITGMQIIKLLMSIYHTYTYNDETALQKTCWYEMVYLGKSKSQPQVEEDIEEIRWAPKEKLDFIFKTVSRLLGMCLRM
jgi:8-oxo-dGTP pyrophosphatase MutT (NUDIX family)